MTSVPSDPTPAKRDTTATALLAAMLVAAALTGVATLSAAGAGALQELLRFAGVGRTTVLEQEQQRQAVMLAEIERILNNVTVDLNSVDARVDIVRAHFVEVGERFGRIDGDLGGLREALAKRAKQGEVASAHGLRDAMLQSDRVVHGALMDLASLRSTFDTNETTNRKEFAAINQRLDRLERTLTGHDITSSVQKKPARRQALRPASTPAPALRAEYAGAPSLRGAELGAARRVGEERQAGAW